MAAEEARSLSDSLAEQEKELKVLLLPKDALDEKNIMLEIRAGTGGDEAGIWAGDLLRMYCKYAEAQASGRGEEREGPGVGESLAFCLFNRL